MYILYTWHMQIFVVDIGIIVKVMQHGSERGSETLYLIIIASRPRPSAIFPVVHERKRYYIAAGLLNSVDHLYHYI